MALDQRSNDTPFATSPPRKRPMVGWFEPRQLLSTGIQVLISAAMAQRFDYRMMEDVALPQGVFNYSVDEATGQPLADLWFDYLADTGDGWTPTFAIASLVSQDWLEVGGRRLPRGHFLLMGGDEVYPVASAENYRERLVGPFETALPSLDRDNPHLFAIPGNHDWYDGLVSFSRRFTQGRWIGAWLTRQRRSYFALKLPHRWWLWAVDVQLESDVDVGQLNYFRKVARQLRRGDRVILASAEPDWLYYDIHEPAAESNLAFLETKIIQPREARVHLWLAGDQHNYQRHENRLDSNFQRITSGGGGAYLSATHPPLIGAASAVSRRLIQVGDDEFVPRCVFPSPATSFRLSLLNLLFLVRNWTFGLLTGVGYATLTWDFGPKEPPFWESLVLHPMGFVLAAFIVLVFAFYADRERPAFRWIGGAIHGAVHVAAALVIARWTLELGAHPLARLALNFAGGLVVGPVVMGLYLLLALNLFDAHRDHAFSALRIQDYKHFLRLHITAQGGLEVFPIGLTKVPRGGARGRYSLIEGPVCITPGPAPADT